MPGKRNLVRRSGRHGCVVRFRMLVGARVVGVRVLLTHAVRSPPLVRSPDHQTLDVDRRYIESVRQYRAGCLVQRPRRCSLPAVLDGYCLQGGAGYDG